jgi:hypothetical protein
MEREGILAVIELKKSVQADDINQAIAQLIAADHLSNYTPVAMLTDLRYDWRFFWIEARVARILTIRDEARRDEALAFARILLHAMVPEEEQWRAETLFDREGLQEDGIVLWQHQRKLSSFPARLPQTAGSEAASSASSSDDDDPESVRRAQLRSLRIRLRNTPWLKEFMRPTMEERRKEYVARMAEDGGERQRDEAKRGRDN